ncbi:ras-related protein Rab-20-like [Pomacea canaliculata]|uniref:ras-related protein Rab-20-like n=1 Tax=Pomacea canaliculata TaxID=400727 RepID=UPI000D72F615|nr:ras-related protein Rab-20-like [Pomacea canaliculata]XP_025091106.1 ras-related protein Rab-20-like [Pomacea canaliculata]
MSFRPDIKLILLGDSNVGKTSLVTRYTQDHFTGCTDVTIGSAFSLREWNNCTIAIWDTAGSEMFNSIPTFHCRGAGAAILAFDINSIKSFDDLSRRFEPMLKEHALRSVSALSWQPNAISWTPALPSAAPPPRTWRPASTVTLTSGA